ncbi:hypothetical protein ANANG_G00100720 [Anguilla anguilla]|uniref:Uncharacterized protein n=1 Tax=Anguilla anguilla TaxID=7936 RepID=A0A9D3MJV4_ANGAN|nr:hypothetical protein ANANG_G00100720 [Anguilla anguilla]
MVTRNSDSNCDSYNNSNSATRTIGKESVADLDGRHLGARAMESPLGQALRQLSDLQERQTAALFKLAQRQAEYWALLRSLLRPDPARQQPAVASAGRCAGLQMPCMVEAEDVEAYLAMFEGTGQHKSGPSCWGSPASGAQPAAVLEGQLRGPRRNPRPRRTAGAVSGTSATLAVPSPWCSKSKMSQIGGSSQQCTQRRRWWSR